MLFQIQILRANNGLLYCLNMRKTRTNVGWIDLLVERCHTHAVTFKPNPSTRGLSLDSLHRLFWKAHMLVDRALLGSRFNLPSRASMRTEAVGIVEGLPDCGHIHGAFKVHPAHWARFESLFADGGGRAERRGIWRKLVPHGTVAVVPIYDAEGWYDYTFKDVWMTDDTDRIVFPPLPVIELTPRV